MALYPKNNFMKKIICISIFMLGMNCYSQKYFPKLNNLFLEQSGSESIFTEDLNYFREGLRTANNKLFYKNLQTSNATNVAFYGMSIIPRFITEVDFLNTGMLLKFNAKSKEEFPSFPIIYNEHTNSDGDSKAGEGTIDILNEGLSLAFTNEQISISNKKPENDKAEFIIKNISYKIDKDNLSIQLEGNFTTDVIIKKKKIGKDSLRKLEMVAKKDSFVISAIHPGDNKSIVILNQKIVKK